MLKRTKVVKTVFDVEVIGQADLIMIKDRDSEDNPKESHQYTLYSVITVTENELLLVAIDQYDPNTPEVCSLTPDHFYGQHIVHIPREAMFDYFVQGEGYEHLSVKEEGDG